MGYEVKSVFVQCQKTYTGLLKIKIQKQNDKQVVVPSYLRTGRKIRV